MRKGYGTYPVLALFFILAVCSMGLINAQGYAQFSDWRNVKVDYATNKYVANFYGSQSEYFRPAQMPGFIDRLNRGDTLRVGLDYYALNVSAGCVPGPILQRHTKELSIGKELLDGLVVVAELRAVTLIEDNGHSLVAE